ncbi:MAG: hypothetical protein CL840_14815 [Crocinitomicaceae bacterium]|mgnify:CR=1 FL=1|nr:hypothetical protein [Crocinitomicaceae bacterium]|tara:strand:- start:6587 stop:6922 length:336 start_codon:yes stop_codon:yes gene_type:complete
MKGFLGIVLIFVLLCCFLQIYSNKRFYIEQDGIPTIGLVSNDSIAEKIAEIITIPLYGKDITSKMIFDAELINDSIWVVTGKRKNPLYAGGIIEFKINKKNCEILKVSHFK